ncbi:hypothetical protein Tco_0628960 [Tanacetum coccineum]|uniref:Retrovirus-related Pol polyprotein from transposon TNT 1-94-like beta-barrel domain-containing protein n=1 Tax=Tanacetum coccineum TaxID=301880 RepID=A0ABQ4WRZ4_9ASTR
MLLECSELTKEERESQLYDDFEHFRQNKGETIHDYYVRFAKLINDMRNIKMTMSRMQLNSKFLNNMLPEWGRFKTAVKLNRGLRDSNYDQLYAYLKQHEAHANENKMMLDRFTQHTVDPPALMSNLTPAALFTIIYNSTIHIFHDRRVVVQNVQGRQNRGQARQTKCYNCNGISHKARNRTQPKRPQNSEYFKDMMLLMQARENGVALDEEKLLFIAGGQDNTIDEDVDEQPVQDLALNVDNVFQADDCNAFDSDVDEAPTAHPQILFMMNLVRLMIQTFYLRFELTEGEQKIDEQLRIVITDRNIKEETLKKELHSVKMQLASTINHNKSMVEEVTSLKKDFKQKENKYLEEFLDMKALKEKNALYNGYEIIKNNHVPAIMHNTEDTLEIAEITRRKKNDKMKDPECVTNKVKIAPLDYSKENYLATFTPHKQLTPEQIFWSHYKELYDSIKITRAKHIEQTTALLTENENLKAQIHENLKCNTIESIKPRVLAPGRYAIDVEPIPPHNRNNREVHLYYLKHLKESVETLREIVEEAKVERPFDRSTVSACRYTKHSHELLEYAIDTCPKAFNQRDKKHASTPLIRKKQVTFDEQCDTSNSNTHKHVKQQNTQKTNVPVPPSTGVNCCTNASGSQPRSNTKKNRISPAKGVNKKKVEEHPRTNKSNLRTTNRVDSSSSSKRTVVQIVLWYLDSGYSKHMMEDRLQIRNFVKKFIGTVRFGNDHFGAIMGYGDYENGNSVISRVYYVEGLGHNLFFV